MLPAQESRARKQVGGWIRAFHRELGDLVVGPCLLPGSRLELKPLLPRPSFSPPPAIVLVPWAFQDLRTGSQAPMPAATLWWILGALPGVSGSPAQRPVPAGLPVHFSVSNVPH